MNLRTISNYFSKEAILNLFNKETILKLFNKDGFLNFLKSIQLNKVNVIKTAGGFFVCFTILYCG